MENMSRKSSQDSRRNIDVDSALFTESQSVQDVSDVMNCVCTSMSCPIVTFPVRRITHKKRRAIDGSQNAMDVLEEKTKSSTEVDQFTQFGNYVANKLRNFKANQTKFAEKLISDVLFEADMGTLNRNWKLVEDDNPGADPQNYTELVLECTRVPVRVVSGTNRELQAEEMAQGSKDRIPTVEMELVPCRVCGRTFVPDRIEYHERVCKATKKEPRKPYDSVSHRWMGTDNEPAIKWIKSNAEPKPPREQRASTRDKNDMPFPKPAQLAEEPVAGKKQPDGRIECPSCMRSFEESAANRHIPGCIARAKGRSSR